MPKAKTTKSKTTKSKTKSQMVRDVMTADPVKLNADAPLFDAAQAMRTSDIGDVIVMQDGRPCGIVTDRDLVVRGIAAGKDPSNTPLREVCSKDLTTISPDEPTDKAVELMRDKAIRRLPVCENGDVVGFVSIGDLAVERDPKSALADISAAPANT
jgi:CBS domain-containing protein